MKKRILATTLATSIITLSACSGNMNSTVVKTDAGNITQEDFYNTMKSSSAGAKVLQQLVTEKVLFDKYKVTDKEVDKELAKYKKQFGDQFQMAIQQYGYTDEASFKEALKGNLATTKAVESSITEKELKAANKPEIRASHILV